MIKIDKEDCLEWLKEVEDNSVNLVVIDPPYNIKKDSWDDIKDYELWMQEVILELQRVLKDNGSFYMFHSEMEIVSDFMRFFKRKTNFFFKQFIVWNKRFEGSKNKGFLDGYIVVDMLRNYQQMAEYILFYTFQDETTMNKDRESLFYPIRNYLIEERRKSGLKMDDINEILVGKRKSDLIGVRYFAMNQWAFPTKEMYEKLQTTGFFQKDYNELENEYNKLKYNFNNLKTHHSVWNYDLVSRKDNHITPKPIELIKNIILHSSNEGDLVLDCFLGTGTTAFACKELDRDFIGCDNNKDYINKIKEELKQTILQV